MKTPFSLIACGTFALAAIFPAQAAELKSAKLTELVRDVRLLAADGTARGAQVGDTVAGRTAVETGPRSRAELLFNDDTLLRLGSETVFSIASGKRTVDLREGSLLLQTAPGSGGVNIRAGSITAAITGSLGLFSVSPPTDPDLAGKELFVKMISVHGKMNLTLNGVVYELEPFQMIFFRVDPQGNLLSEPIIETLDGEKLVKSSKLINGFEDSERIDRDEILAQLNLQGDEKRRNNWTVVATDVNNRIPGLPGKSVINLNSLINRFLAPEPPPPVIIVPVEEPPPPPPPPPPPKRKKDHEYEGGVGIVRPPPGSA